MVKQKKFIYVGSYTYIRHGRKIHFWAYKRINPSWRTAKVREITNKQPIVLIEKPKKFKYRLTVSTRLYCGDRVQTFEEYADYKSQEEARSNRQNLATLIIESHKSHCGTIPKEVNYKIDAIQV